LVVRPSVERNLSSKPLSNALFRLALEITISAMYPSRFMRLAIAFRLSVSVMINAWPSLRFYMKPIIFGVMVIWLCCGSQSGSAVADLAAEPEKAGLSLSARCESLDPRSGEFGRSRSSFDFDWRFLKEDVASATNADFNDSTWRVLNLPHDWSIEQTPDRKFSGANGFYPGGIGWYRKGFFVPAALAGRRIAIEFDGVYHRSKIYLNGQCIGEQPYGYASFSFDLTAHLNYGATNIIAVRVDHSDAPTSRWYSGSGIYRHVWLTVTGPLHIAHWGSYITTPKISGESAQVVIRTTVQNEGKQSSDSVLLTSIKDVSGAVVAESESSISVPADGRQEVEQKLSIDKPSLWSVETPVLYTAESSLKAEGHVADNYRTPFGIRDLRFDSDKGFFLNGKSMKLKGMCLHHDAGCLGAAVPVRAWERRLETMRELGCNAIRTSHNSPAPEFLDLCDRMGFLVIDEAFDKWTTGGYYGKMFTNGWEHDLNAMIQRDRNHPSIILWSVGNEVIEQDTTNGAAVLKRLVDYVHQHEPSRLVTCALWPRTSNKNGFSEAPDVCGYNYQEHWYAADKKQFPKRMILGTECYPYYHGRADYGTTNALNNFYCDFTSANPWYDVANNDFVIGQFLWIGIDYLGESAGWPSKGWCNGLIDTAGFVKPIASFHRSVWNSRPMVQIGVLDDALDIDPGHLAWSWPNTARHWNFPRYANRLIRVETVSNCQAVELFINDKSLGVRRVSDYPNNTIPWSFEYNSGTLRAVGLSDGMKVASDEIKTAGPPAKIVLKADRKTILADGQDIANIEIQLVDANGVPVPDSDKLIKLNVKGPGTVIGMDNGDMRSPEPYKASQHTTQWGRVLGVVQASRQPGAMKITATSAGLPEATVSVESQSSQP
jgi:beta-galactosidase